MHRALATTAASLAGLALAQLAPPRFAPPNLAPAGVRALAATCAPCHGPEGHPAAGSTSAALAGRPAGELEAAMAAFRDGERPGTVMPQIAKGYSGAEVAAMAAYFAQEPR